ncbi:MAG TPA: hypothetical protein VF378_05425 [Geothrix sp.]
MNPLFLVVPVLALQAPQAHQTPFPEVEAKDLPAAPRGPMPPMGADQGAESGAMGQLRRSARHGPSIPALQLPAGSLRVKDKIPDISGWRAYAIEVPGGGTVKVHVVEGRKGWLRVLGLNAWGREEEGLLQNRIPTGEPQATYKNPTKETRTMYFIVDSLDANMVGDAFTVEITRG